MNLNKVFVVTEELEGIPIGWVVGVFRNEHDANLCKEGASEIGNMKLVRRVQEWNVD